MKRFVFILLTIVIPVCVSAADDAPKPRQQITELKAQLFDISLQIKQLQQQEQQLFNRLVDLIKAEAKPDSKKEKKQ